MKRSLALFLLLALTLCACGKAPTALPSDPLFADAATPSPTEVPTLPTSKMTESALSGNIAADPDGRLWTNLADLDNMGYPEELFLLDTGYVYSFLISEDTLYAAIKNSLSAMDGTRLYEISLSGGEPRLLAENGSGACVFCLLGDTILLYPAETGGLWAVDLAEGTVFEALPEAVSLLAARNGLVYYTKADNSLYRNDSTGLAEEKLLDNCPSYWLMPGENGFCCLAYADSETALLEFRNEDGTLRFRQPLAEAPAGLYSDGTQVYVPFSGGSLSIYDMTTGETRHSIPLEPHENILILYADETQIFYQTSDGGSFSLWRMNADGSDPILLAENIY